MVETMKPLRYTALFMAGVVCTIGTSIGGLLSNAQAQEPTQQIAQLPVATRAIDNPFCPLPGQGFVNQSLTRIAGYESQNYYVLICSSTNGQLFYYLANKTQGGVGSYVGYAVPSGSGYVVNNGTYASTADNTQIRVVQNGNSYAERVLATTASNPSNPAFPIPPSNPNPNAGLCPTDAGSGVMVARYTTHNHDVYICQGRGGVSSNPQQNYLVVDKDRSGANRPIVLPAISTGSGYSASDGNIIHVIDRTNYKVTVQGYELFSERVISCRGAAAGCGA
jgi:hypothetical protein